ncbi:hypothetical protein [Leisingera aquaemixtae]|uniref:Uncharacterized protein n=1 Tax=Leisingera aquaemixtae TaxID=1396826 RepID=A0A0P1HE29_9RHOB|nr:hypothetical protein [Leisingera aquaemixtae]CUI01883.1 hypothetical protein PHA8399_04032 [Leisingera aquaemixtae]
MAALKHRGYSAGHPWYYLLGGEIPPLRAIFAQVSTGAYRGYLASEIDAIAGKAKPQRSAALAACRAKLTVDLKADIARYRQCACSLRRYREETGAEKPVVAQDVHTAISLKFNHIVNGFANLRTLDAVPQQADMFDLF